MEENTNIFNAPEIEDMPDFEEETTETPCKGAESVDNQSADSGNAIVSEENEGETEESAEETAEKTEDKPKEDKAKKESKPSFKSNLPTGFSFNPLVVAIKPFYQQLIAEDEIFANVVKERESRKEKPKSLAECADYIMSEVYNYAVKHKQGNFGFAGFPDEEMVRLIRHYYDEEFLEVQKIQNARASVATTTTTATATTAKKKEEKKKPVKNVVDITKAIVTATKPSEDGKKPKREKKKDNLLAGFVPMERPNLETYEKDAKKGSKEQAKSVEQMDLFADFFAN